MTGLSAFAVAALYIGVVLLLVLVVLWVALPFAVFGAKDLLRQLITEQKRTNVMLELATRNARERNAPKERP
jgi:hypothetical protein